MTKPKVAITRLNEYDPDKISAALEKCLALAGDFENILKPGSNIFVKINHLSSLSPEKGIITHPLFTRAVLSYLKNWDVRLTVGDDIQSAENNGFAATGYLQVCKKLGVRLVNLRETGFVEIPCRGSVLNKTFISPLVLDADSIINLPKLKTHSFTMFTGGIKNMFGVIPWGMRIKYHRIFYRVEDFCRMLVDIFSCVRPALSIMDAVIAMEGEGPSAGSLRKTGLILAGMDTVALDAVASRIIGFNPLDIQTTRQAQDEGLGIGLINSIEVTGENLASMEIRDFRHSAIAVNFLKNKIPSFLYAYFQNHLSLIPEIARDRCPACLLCLKTCPTKAISSGIGENMPFIDQDRCIRCMCCHEVCSHLAIDLRQTRTGWMMRKMYDLYRKLHWTL